MRDFKDTVGIRFPVELERGATRLHEIGENRIHVAADVAEVGNAARLEIGGEARFAFLRELTETGGGDDAAPFGTVAVARHVRARGEAQLVHLERDGVRGVEKAVDVVLVVLVEKIHHEFVHAREDARERERALVGVDADEAVVLVAPLHEAFGGL